MANNLKSYYIYLRSTRERIPCTKEEFDNYYRDINAFRQKQQYHGRCVCPERKRLDCDMDCATCPFSRAGDNRSLDYTVTDKDGNRQPWVDMLEDPTASFEEAIAERYELKTILDRLVELMPQAFDIGRLRQEGLSDTAISRKIGIPRKTFTDRIRKVHSILKTEFPEYF